MLKEARQITETGTVAEASANSRKPVHKGTQNLKPFPKGVSGNPKGRPKKDYDLAAEAQKYKEVAVTALFEVASDRTAPQAARVSAANAILDRGFGKPIQQVDANVTHNFADEFNNFVRQLSSRHLDDMKVINHE